MPRDPGDDLRQAETLASASRQPAIAAGSVQRRPLSRRSTPSAAAGSR
ncbi:MAG: hypothetical protein U1E35_04265 [Rhodospirillales bacterium]